MVQLPTARQETRWLCNTRFETDHANRLNARHKEVGVTFTHG